MNDTLPFSSAARTHRKTMYTRVTMGPLAHVHRNKALIIDINGSYHVA
jgi:hypothetical protein